MCERQVGRDGVWFVVLRAIRCRTISIDFYNHLVVVTASSIELSAHYIFVEEACCDACILNDDAPKLKMGKLSARLLRMRCGPPNLGNCFMPPTHCILSPSSYPCS
jgi:hypothetical protein